MATPWRYRIRAQGRLSERWRHWFDDMEVEITSETNAEVTTLTGPVADQAALLGLLQHLYTLGLPLLSVQCVGGGKIDNGPGARVRIRDLDGDANREQRRKDGK